MLWNSESVLRKGCDILNGGEEGKHNLKLTMEKVRVQLGNNHLLQVSKCSKFCACSSIHPSGHRLVFFYVNQHFLKAMNFLCIFNHVNTVHIFAFIISFMTCLQELSFENLKKR